MVCRPRLLFSSLVFALVLGAAPVAPPYVNLGTSAVNQTTGPTTVPFYVYSGTPVTYRMAYGQEFVVDTSTCSGSSRSYQCSVAFTPHAPGLRRDALLVLDSDGNVLLTEYLFGIGQSSVPVITPGTISTLNVPSPGLVYTGASTYDPADNLYIADYGSGRIYKINTAGIVSLVSITGDVPAKPSGIVFDGAGNFYVSDNDANRIIKVAPNGTGTALTLSTPLAHPAGLAIDTYSNLYIADSGHSQIVKVNPYGNPSVLTISTTLSSPVSLTLDLAGALYISEPYSSTVVKVISARSGGSSSVLTPSIALVRPGGLEVDPAGNLYVADANAGVNKVYRIAPDGASTVVAGTGSAIDSGDGSAATSAGLNTPQFLSLAPDGKLTIVEKSAIRIVSSPVALPDFGNTNLGAMSALQNVQVSNIGNQDISLSALSVTGDFLPDPSSTCSPGAPLTYTSAGCSVVLGFMPTQAGARTGILTVTPGLQLSLAGTGIGTGSVTVNTTPLNFGNVPAGSPSLPQTVTITNHGTGALNVTSAVISGPNAADFTLINNCLSSLTTGAPCTVSVTFQPSTIAAETATLVITYADALTCIPVTQTIPLSGTGVAGSSPGTLPSGPLHFVAVPPCRLADTRRADGPLGGPHLTGGIKRDFSISSGACSIPSNAEAYAINVTVVPEQPEPSYVRAWAAGQAQPLAVVLNTEDGKTKGNATIVQAGTYGNISIWSEHDTQLVLDITGYFVPDASQASFHPLPLCRAVDTRGAQGPLGSPALTGNATRTFNLASVCGLPATATAYMLNFTVVPRETLGYLQAWGASSPQPGTSILNSVTGTTVANAALIQPDANGQISVYATDDTDLVIDVGGYFASGSGGLSLYTMAPCRAFDTRATAPVLPFTGTQTIPMSDNTCGATPSAQAYLFNTGVIPQEDTLAYLQLWAHGGSQPPTSTLNAEDGTITSNMAVVPTINGAINAYTTNATHLVLDIYGYFAP